MKDALSAAGRALAAERWQARRPIRLAHELVRRASELPDSERQELRQALEDAGKATK
jgi:hypothetical protein